MDIYAAALPGCPGLGAKNIRELIDHFNTPEDVWNASEKDIIDLHVLTPAREKAFLKYRRETDLEKLEKKLLGLGIRWCTWEDSTYPSLLAETSNPPAVLYYMGTSPSLKRR